MQTIWDTVTQFGGSSWFALAVVLMVLESIVPGVHFIWFGLSAVVVGIISLLTHVPWQWQLILFAVIAMATVFVVRRQSHAEGNKTDEPDLNVRGSQYIGRVVTVEDPISVGRGRVRVGDTVWLAEGEDAGKGERVKVTGVNGTALVVMRVAD